MALKVVDPVYSAELIQRHGPVAVSSLNAIEVHVDRPTALLAINALMRRNMQIDSSLVLLQRTERIAVATRDGDAVVAAARIMNQAVVEGGLDAANSEVGKIGSHLVTLARAGKAGHIRMIDSTMSEFGIDALTMVRLSTMAVGYDWMGVASKALKGSEFRAIADNTFKRTKKLDGNERRKLAQDLLTIAASTRSEAAFRSVMNALLKATESAPAKTVAGAASIIAEMCDSIVDATVIIAAGRMYTKTTGQGISIRSLQMLLNYARKFPVDDELVTAVAHAVSACPPTQQPALVNRFGQMLQTSMRDRILEYAHVKLDDMEKKQGDAKRSLRK